MALVAPVPATMLRQPRRSARDDEQWAPALTLAPALTPAQALAQALASAARESSPLSTD
jgi:hypothetical protein